MKHLLFKAYEVVEIGKKPSVKQLNFVEDVFVSFQTAIT